MLVILPCLCKGLYRCCCCCGWRSETCAKHVVVRVRIMTSAMTTLVTSMTDLVWMSQRSCKDQDRRAATWRLNSATHGYHPASPNRRWSIPACIT